MFSFSAESDIYDDDNNEDFEEISSTTTSFSQIKVTPNITSHFPAHAEEVLKTDYEDESDSYQHEFNDDETTNQDESQRFADTIPAKPINRKPELSNSNNKKLPDFSSTSRLPFLSANLWRDLFSKPGILVGKFRFFVKNEKYILFKFRYYRWSCHWYVICYSSCYVYNLSNA